jgi:DNA-binding CsgD family transcriptional regulator
MNATVPFPCSRRDAGALSELLHLIYDAAINPSHWCAVTKAIAASFDSDKGLLFTPYTSPQDGGLIFPAGISEHNLQLWGSVYIEHDVWAQEAQARNLWRDGDALLDEQLVAHDDFVKSVFYREFLSTQDIGRLCVGVVFSGAPGLPRTSLAIFRSLQARPFDDDDKEWMRLIVAHVSRSLGVMQRLDLARLQSTSQLAAFDRLQHGVVLLDGEMRVVHVNQTARTVLQRHDGLVLNADQMLENLGTSRKARLMQWLAEFRDAPEHQQGHFLGGCRVSRRNSGGYYLVQCSPLPASNHWSQPKGKQVRYIAFITDPAAITLPDAAQLIQLFGLTRTQARVALAFAEGASYKEVAHRLGSSEETIRSHIKEIYPKMRVNRKSDLVRLVLSLAKGSV